MIARISLLLGLLLALVAARETVFTGSYSDPKHPKCAREIRLESNVSALVFGTDAAGGEGKECDGETDTKWGPLPGKKHEMEIVVDFSSKGGPSNLRGKYDESKKEIKWQDGNVWTKVK
jgi:hypothetical protein